MLPFVSKRGIVRAADLMDAEAFENAQRYSDRLRLLIEALCAGFDADDGERPGRPRVRARRRDRRRRAAGPPRRRVRRHRAVVPAHDRLRRPRAPPPAAAHPGRAGAALLRLAAAARLRRGRAGKQVNVVDARARRAGRRAGRSRCVAGRPLRTLVGTFEELAALDVDGDPWLRVVVRGPAGPGWPTRSAALLGPGVVDVRLDDAGHDVAGSTRATTAAAARRSCSTSTWPARASTTTGCGPCSPSCSTPARGARRREAGAPGAGGLRRVPRP